MKKKQHILIAMAILPCLLFLAVAFSVGKLKHQTNLEGQSSTKYKTYTLQEDEITTPFSLKTLSTFLLQ